MSNGLTPVSQEQLDKLSNFFLELSMTLDQIRASDARLSDAETKQLGAMARQLNELSGEVDAAAIGQLLAGLQPRLDNIIQTTRAAQEQAKEAKTIQKVFSIAGAALTLASALASGSAPAVLAAAGGLGGAIGGSSALGTEGGTGGHP